MAKDSEVVKIDVFSSSHCTSCQKIKRLTYELCLELNDERIKYQELDVVENIDYAVQIGILRTPAVAMNGALVFSSMPSKEAFRKAILEQLNQLPHSTMPFS